MKHVAVTIIGNHEESTQFLFHTYSHFSWGCAAPYDPTLWIWFGCYNVLPYCQPCLFLAFLSSILVISIHPNRIGEGTLWNIRFNKNVLLPSHVKAYPRSLSAPQTKKTESCSCRYITYWDTLSITSCYLSNKEDDIDNVCMYAANRKPIIIEMSGEKHDLL